MNIVWIHEDAITLDHPVMDAAGRAAQPIFIWDTKEHDCREYSAKRRVFIYECAHDLGVPIYTGDPHEILPALANGGRIFAAESSDSYIRDVISGLSEEYNAVMVAAPDLTQIPENTDTGRFFRFWNQAKKSALTHSSHASMEDRSII